MRDSHPSRKIPAGMGTKLLKLMEIGRGMGIAQMGMGMLIIKVFPCSRHFPPLSAFDLVDL